MKTMKLLAAAFLLLALSWTCKTGNNTNQLLPQDELRDKSADDKKELSLAKVAPAPGYQLRGATTGLNQDANPAHNTEEYSLINENEFKDVKANPLSTFSIDVDKASYSNTRRYLMGSSLPPKDAVRIEEMINYFKYDYPDPTDEHPFSINFDLADTPWNKDSKLFLVGIQGKNLNYNDLKPCNLVFLVDSSGSMEDENKLPLLKKSLTMLVNTLSARDRVAVVAYAGSAGLILDSTDATQKNTIIGAMDKLQAGGSTAGAEGLELAYQVAEKNHIAGGNNRVILCTDGDFNVGVSSTSELVRFITEKRKKDIYITLCGFGMGNYKDGRMEEISKAGNGNFFYIDSIKEAQKVFVKEMRANMFTIAKDVKIQIEFNPNVVKAYRLVGYENRLLAAEDFKDDSKDAGELGAGHTVTALYEIIPADSAVDVRTADPLKYQTATAAGGSDEMLTIKFRYKPIHSDVSIPMERVVKYAPVEYKKAGQNLRWAMAVAEFSMLLRDSKFKGTSSFDSVTAIAKAAKGKDEEGYRGEFLDLVERAKLLSAK